MAIVFTAAGAAATALSGNITPTLPAGFAADDILILVVYSVDNVVLSLPSGWTNKIETSNGATMLLTVAWCRATAGQSDPTVTHTAGSLIIGRVCGFRGASASGDPIEVSASQANATSTTVTAPTISTLSANAMVAFVGCSFNATGGFSGYSGTDPTFTEGMDSFFSGEDESICLAYGIKAGAGATGSRTATSGATGINIGALFALTETAAGGTNGASYRAPKEHPALSDPGIGSRELLDVRAWV
jgi:hypothetical protein